MSMLSLRNVDQQKMDVEVSRKANVQNKKYSERMLSVDMRNCCC